MTGFFSVVKADDVAGFTLTADQKTVTENFDGMWDATTQEATLVMPAGWRGIKPTSNENGVLVFPLPNDGGTYNLILNGEGDGVQQDISQVVANQSYLFTAN